MREEELQTKWSRQAAAGVPFRELSLGQAGSGDTSWSWWRPGAYMQLCAGPQGGGRAEG